MTVAHACAENTGCTDARQLKRLRTEQSDAEDNPPAQVSKMGKIPVNSPEPVSAATPSSKQEPATAPDTAEQQPSPSPHASEQEPAAAPCDGPSQSENQPADTPQQPCNRVLLEPNLLCVPRLKPLCSQVQHATSRYKQLCWQLCRLQQYVELLRSQLPQHVLQALNPLLLLSRNESHARALAQYPPLFPALFSAIHAFHVAVDCRLLRCESNRTGSLARDMQPAAPAGSSDTLSGKEGTDEADPSSTQEGVEACAPQKRADTTPEEAWQAQLAVAAATVVHHLAMVCSPLCTSLTMPLPLYSTVHDCVGHDLHALQIAFLLVWYDVLMLNSGTAELCACCLPREV